MSGRVLVLPTILWAMASGLCAAGFGISYDVTPQNFPIISLPPQLQTEQNPTITCNLPGAPAWCADFTGRKRVWARASCRAEDFSRSTFLAPTRLLCRASTTRIIVPVVEPKVFTWSLGVQHEVGWNSSLEVRYVGTRSLELPDPGPTEHSDRIRCRHCLQFPRI